MVINKTCLCCNIRLTSENWYPSTRRKHHYLCILCMKKKSKESGNSGRLCNYMAGYSCPKKVYCKDCKWYKITNPNATMGLFPIGHCSYSENIKETVDDSWYERTKTYGFISEARELNKNNDCKWFEEKK